MVNRIDRVYEQGHPTPMRQQEVAKSAGEAKTADVFERGGLRRENVAERIAPHLHDQVEISEKAREAIRAAEAKGLPDRSPVENQTLRELEGSWYATGYQQALEQMDATNEPQV